VREQYVAQWTTLRQPPCNRTRILRDYAGPVAPSVARASAGRLERTS
jgi:hypothetical protein